MTPKRKQELSQWIASTAMDDDVREVCQELLAEIRRLNMVVLEQLNRAAGHLEKLREWNEEDRRGK